MKAARYYGDHDIRVEEVEEPQPREGQVVVDVEWCGICGSDLHEYLIGPTTLLPTKDRPSPNGVYVPVTLGHELCGRTLGYVGGNTGFGGYGEVVVVDESSLHVLPPEIALEYAAIIEPLAVTYHAIKVSGITEWKDRDVLVVGGGPIGFALLLVLKAVGANRVILSEPAAARRKQVADLASATINPIEEDVAQRVQELTAGRGAEVVFDCAGVPVGLESAMNAIRYEGLYVMVAVWEKPMTIPCTLFLAKHITMKGTLIFADGDFEGVMDLMASGRLAGYERLVTARIGLDDIVQKGFEELVNRKDEHIKILVKPR
ncbi:hypothetical protein CBER1_06512 [Cercospora berteroae]|uniref:Enoyl reductase (ER) domain-containing protein n=1 Tax=Cercospora berteroae TaxID=357750 RepID=A0A2S6BTZ2_9PEZI|nr:hypothetical protein CBER1_06512 [Cercospora berteroae]